jgi:hypothetical protein
MGNNGIIDIADCGYMVLKKEGQNLTIEEMDGIEHKKN